MFGLEEYSLVYLITPNKSALFYQHDKGRLARRLTWRVLGCSDLWPYWMRLWLICEFSASWNQPWCAGNGISRSGEMVCKKVVYIALKWPMPRSELPYVAIWKSWEIMLLNIKASVCVSVCEELWYCVFMAAWGTCNLSARHSSHFVCVCVWVCVFPECCPSFYLFLDVSPICLHDSPSSVKKTAALCVSV